MKGEPSRKRDWVGRCNQSRAKAPVPNANVIVQKGKGAISAEAKRLIGSLAGGIVSKYAAAAEEAM